MFMGSFNLTSSIVSGIPLFWTTLMKSFCAFVASDYAVPAGICRNVYNRSGTDGIYKNRTSYLYGGDIDFRNTDCMSDDL